MSVLEEVRACLAERLALPVEEVLPESRLLEDLGSDSLDLLDLVFSLEKRFGIKLRHSQLDRLLRAEAIPEEDRPSLEEWLPDLQGRPGPLTPGLVFSLVTVQSLANLVQRTKGEPDARRA